MSKNYKFVIETLVNKINSICNELWSLVSMKIVSDG